MSVRSTHAANRPMVPSSESLWYTPFHNVLNCSRLLQAGSLSVGSGCEKEEGWNLNRQVGEHKLLLRAHEQQGHCHHRCFAC